MYLRTQTILTVTFVLLTLTTCKLVSLKIVHNLHIFAVGVENQQQECIAFSLPLSF